MAKAVFESKADVVVLDLEDAVAPSRKADARSSLKSFFSLPSVSGSSSSSSSGSGSSFNSSDISSVAPSSRRADIVVRVNCPKSSPWGVDDLALLSQLLRSQGAEGSISAVLLPKVESSAGATSAREQLNDGGSTPLWAMIETARGVINCVEIARSEAVEGLVFGSNDLTKDLRAQHTPSREPLLYAMSRCVLAARSEGKAVLDGVHIDIKDLSGLRDSCAQGRALGFDGKSLIHPMQVPVANECFSPSAAELAHAHAVVAAWDAAAGSGADSSGSGSREQGVIVVNGQMIEALHVEQARLLLQEQAAIDSAAAAAHSQTQQ